MAGSERQEKMPGRLFRYAAEAVLKLPEGERITGRGIVAPLQGESWKPAGAVRHPLGGLTAPYYCFTGDLPGLPGAAGGVLEQGGRRYTVLNVREIVLEGKLLCVQALLERRNADDGS